MGAFADKTASELQTLITNIDAAITRTLNAESYQIGTRRIDRPSLKQLQDIRASAVKQLRAIQGNDIGVVTFEPQPDPDPKFR